MMKDKGKMLEILKMRMPDAHKKKDPMLEMGDEDFEMEEMPKEGEEEAFEGEEGPEEESNELQSIPDDVLLAEIKRRGLSMGKKEAPESEKPSDEDESY